MLARMHDAQTAAAVVLWAGRDGFALGAVWGLTASAIKRLNVSRIVCKEWDAGRSIMWNGDPRL
jgi:hypothetical protein